MQKTIAVLFERDLKRLEQEVRAFPDDATLWKTVPGFANPAGNLALHIEGNLREYVGRQMAGHPYLRDRPLEFAAKGAGVAQVAERIATLRAFVVEAVSGLSDETLASTFPEPMWGKEHQTGLFLLALLTHLNYHLGQIDCLRRTLTGNGAIDLANL